MNTEEKTNRPMFEEFLLRQANKFERPEIKATPLVSKEELKDIVARYQHGDSEAKQQLKDSNMRFVASIARQYVDKGLTNDELIAAGTEGLLIAAKKFDPAKEFRFIVYAMWWIRQSILLALKTSGNEEGVQLYKEFEKRQAKFKEIDDMLHSGQLTKEFSAAIDTLNLEEKKILLYSYGFGFTPCTDNEICKKLAITPYQLSQSRSLLIIKLRKQLIKQDK